MSDHTGVIPGKVAQKMLRVHGVTCSPHVLAVPKQSKKKQQVLSSKPRKDSAKFLKKADR
jgi:chorismate synthase